MENFSPNEVLEPVIKAMSEKIVGQKSLIEGVLMCFIAGGHVLIEGLPGLAKTLLAKTFASLLQTSFKRIQFTPDLLPSDIIGTLIFLQQKGRFALRRGSIFSNIILLDEINRAPAKVQSALLEAMEERQVTIGRKTYTLPDPFFVLATENPIEEEGTYPLSEAQKDRFLIKLIADYPHPDEEERIVEKISCTFFNNKELSEKKEIFPLEKLSDIRDYVQTIKVSKEITSYIVSIVSHTRPSFIKEKNLDYASYIDFGSSPRASIAMHVLAKIFAMFNARSFVIPDDIKRVAPLVLRHRIKLSYQALADEVSADNVISSILNTVKQP